MASTYSDRLKLELMETGANANTWGNNTNTNLQTLDAFSAGYLSKSVAGSANVTLTTANADPDAESSNKVIEFSGALTGNIYVFIPAVENNYIFFNNTSGAYTLTIAPTGHAANGVAITQGAHTIMYNNANNEIKDLFSGSLGNLSLVSGGVFTGNASGASALNASNVSSGTLPDARFPATLPTTSGANLTNLNASNVSSGTLSNDRLDTVSTAKGGTGLTAIGSADQVLKVNSGGTALEFGDAGGGGNTNAIYYTSPATYSPPAGLVAIRVTVVGAGGSGGVGGSTNPGAGRQGGHGGGGGYAQETLYPATVTGPVSVTAGGGTNSFGGFLSATAGSSGNPGNPDASGNPGGGGSGSGGDYNHSGDASGNAYQYGVGGTAAHPSTGGTTTGFGRGGGGAGGFGGQQTPYAPGPGAPGIVIVEEYF